MKMGYRENYIKENTDGISRFLTKALTNREPYEGMEIHHIKPQREVKDNSMDNLIALTKESHIKITRDELNMTLSERRDLRRDLRMMSK
jgi:hypothetical protein